MSINFKSEEEVREFLKNLGIEYRFGCFSEKKPEVCHLLGDYLETIDKNYEKAWKIYQNNCDSANFPRSCYKCGNYLSAGRGGQKADLVKAMDYYEKGCNLGVKESCQQAGLLAVAFNARNNPIRSFKQAIKFFEKGCEGRNPDSCYHLSSIYLDGIEKEKIAKDMERSFQYALKACDMNNMYACANISLMYKNGDGVEQNEELSRKYKAKAKEIQDDILTQRQQLQFQQGLS